MTSALKACITIVTFEFFINWQNRWTVKANSLIVSNGFLKTILFQTSRWSPMMLWYALIFLTQKNLSCSKNQELFLSASLKLIKDSSSRLLQICLPTNGNLRQMSSSLMFAIVDMILRQKGSFNNIFWKKISKSWS